MTYSGVYIEEISGRPPTIEGVATSIAAFVGYTRAGDLDKAVDIHRFADFERTHGGLDSDSPLSYAVSQFFENGGAHAIVVRVAKGAVGSGLHALRDVDFHILCVPETFDMAADPGPVVREAAKLVTDRRAFYIVDPPSGKSIEDIADWAANFEERNLAVYFPALCIADPRGGLRTIPASGGLAGVYARTDRERGVWKAPAGSDAAMRGVDSVSYALSEAEVRNLNRMGVNALRVMAGRGLMPWGSRTMRGSDANADEYKYIPVRRLALYIEESLFRGTRWVVFEPNDEPLWAKIRLHVGAFMQQLFRHGAFQGTTPEQAYFVRCDATTTTWADRNMGIVNIELGFAPLKPAEFVVIRVSQRTADITN